MSELTTTEWALTEIAAALTRIADALSARTAGVDTPPRTPSNQVRQESTPPRKFGDGKSPNWWGMLYHRAKNAGYDCNAMAQETFNISDSKKLTVAQVKTLLDSLPEEQI
jgi:hypothetical protein